MYTISKEFAFEASHRLVGLKPGHQCMRDHGRFLPWRVTLQGEALNEHTLSWTMATWLPSSSTLTPP